MFVMKAYSWASAGGSSCIVMKRKGTEGGGNNVGEGRTDSKGKGRERKKESLVERKKKKLQDKRHGKEREADRKAEGAENTTLRLNLHLARRFNRKASMSL
jgi:hypothetical protein